MSADPIREYENLLKSGELLFVVYYRGHWCPFCVSYLKDLVAIIPSIKAAKGNTIIVTAESADQLQTVRDSTGYAGPAINDPQNLLAEELKRRGLLNVAFTPKKGYPFGMAQPAVLVQRKDGTVLEQWAIVPSLMNAGGAKDRPALDQVWENSHAKLHNRPIVHKRYRLQTMASILWQMVKPRK